MDVFPLLAITWRIYMGYYCSFMLYRDITDKSPENFSGHLMAPDHEFGGIFVRSMHLK